MFVDAENGDLRLLPGSPMIDAGYPGTPDLPEFDIERTPRVLGESVDIGAYEFDDGSDPRGILFVTSDGTGTGAVTSDPAGIDCGADCAHAFLMGTPVTLTGMPDGTSVFDGWGGDPDCQDGQLTMDGNHSCTATFSRVHRVTVIKAGEGDGTLTSNPAGINCGASCNALFYRGENVALSATADTNSTFAGWSGDAACPAFTNLSANQRCTATFNPILYRLLVTVVGQGDVRSDPAGIDCGRDCGEDFTSGTVVTLTATPKTGYRFVGWGGPCAGSNPACVVTVDAITGLSAHFAPAGSTAALSVTKAGTGTGTVTSQPSGIDCGSACAAHYLLGTSVRLTATPSTGARFDGWSGHADCADGQIALDAARQCTATFTATTSNAKTFVGLYAPGSGRVYLRNAHSGGPANVTFGFGPAGRGWLPLVGDWNNDGLTTIGLHNPAGGTFYLRNANSGGAADVTFAFGPAGPRLLPLTGDWDGDGQTTVGLYNPSTGTFYLRNAHSGGAANVTFRFGPAGADWLPLTGDWDGDRRTTVGLYNPSTGTFYLRNANTGGAADASFGFGPSGRGWLPLTGDWDGDGRTTVGLYNPTAGTFYLRNANGAGPADVTFAFGPAGAGWTPLTGDWVR